ncbi:Exosome 3'-5' exoribonuclease complex, subunit PM/SCL-100 (Rrp6) [Pseudoloma neurophilia]|uniref:Exosome 3'-5' exoribonuclease complex, subunit PM/SCL-100 (Rrp6) n=1 Tax=Pseudoloma neurophilia TaxID=146866 RepID=A0A0R0LSW3_9MICR|nr:Exosome 3'-5' exoribonuclease complex, subunit PM/SCL-100 (Rrp6) [Pseudoloma neurophilia]
MIINIANEMMININKALHEINDSHNPDIQLSELKEIVKELNDLIKSEDYYLERIDYLHSTGKTLFVSKNIEIFKDQKKIGLIGQNILKPVLVNKEIEKNFTLQHKDSEGDFTLQQKDSKVDFTSQQKDSKVDSTSQQKDSQINSTSHHKDSKLDFSFESFQKLKERQYITNQAEFDKMVQYLEQKENTNNSTIMLHVFSHGYHSYLPYVCYLMIRSQHYDFMIDMLKYSEISIENILTCKFYKLIDVQSLWTISRQFKVKLCCFQIVNLKERYLVDWRIKADDFWFDVVLFNDFTEKDLKQLKQYEKNDKLGINKKYEQFNKLKHMVEKYSDTDFLQPYDSKSDLEFSFEKIMAFENGLDESKLMKLLKLRDFIAKTNNESRDYVMTDRQIHSVLKNKTVERMSPLMRAHLADITFIMGKTDEAVIDF